MLATSNGMPNCSVVVAVRRVTCASMPTLPVVWLCESESIPNESSRCVCERRLPTFTLPESKNSSGPPLRAVSRGAGVGVKDGSGSGGASAGSGAAFPTGATINGSCSIARTGPGAAAAKCSPVKAQTEKAHNVNPAIRRTAAYRFEKANPRVALLAPRPSAPKIFDVLPVARRAIDYYFVRGGRRIKDGP